MPLPPSSRPSILPATTPTRGRFSPITLVVTIAVLYLAREVLIPLALAILFSFLLGPAVRKLERRGMWRAVATALVAGAFFLLFAGVGWIVFNQSLDLAGQLPTYQDNIQQKLTSLRGPAGGSFRRAAKAVENINKKLEEAGTDAAVEAAGPSTATNPVSGRRDDAASPPVAVKIVEPSFSPTQILGNLAGPVLGPLATAGIVIVFTIFLLLEAEDLRDRLLHLAGSERLSVTTQAVNDAGKRVSRYLRMQALINTGYGLAVAGGLALIGVPSAALWGLLSGCLRFVPFLGVWVATAFPLIISFAAFDKWSPLVETVVLFGLLELIVCNVVEPWLFSSSTGVSTVAVVVAATFWTWLWGPVGLLLATPLTVCIVVLGRYVPQLEFLHTMLGDAPALPPDSRLYQRLLAFDQEAVAEIADEHLKENTPIDFYDHVLIPALNQAQLDTRQGRLGEDTQTFIRQTTQTLIEELQERPRTAFVSGHATPESADSTQKKAATVAAGLAKLDAPCPVAPLSVRVVILPARNEADEAAGNMLAHLLALDCIGAEVLSSKLLVQEMLGAVAEHQPALVFISALRPFAVMHARYLSKRLRAQDSAVKIMIGLWDAQKEGTLTGSPTTAIPGAAAAPDKRPTAPVDGVGVVSTMQEAVNSAREFLPPATTVPADMLAASQAAAAPAEKEPAGV